MKIAVGSTSLVRLLVTFPIERAARRDCVGCRPLQLATTRRRVARVMLAACVLTPSVLLAAPQSTTTTRVSLTSSGMQSNLGSYYPSISADGRFVVFESDASDLVPGDTNGAVDVFVFNRQTGTIQRVSVNSNGVQGNSDSAWPSISGDGRYVAFMSQATNFTSIDFNFDLDVYVRDTVAGTTTLVTASNSGFGTGNAGSWAPKITPDGRFVAFYSAASDLLPSLPDLNGEWDTFVYDGQTGQIALVSVGTQGQQGNWPSAESPSTLGSVPAISADGRFVAFESEATNFVANDANGHASDIFLRDRQLGTTTIVSTSSSGVQGNNYSRAPSISADGRYVAFGSNAQNLVPNDTSAFDIFVKDTLTGTTERVNLGPGGAQGTGAGLQLVPVTGTAISADGRFVGFGSAATTLVPPDTNGVFDVFVHDRLLGLTTLVSESSSGAQGNGQSTNISLSADGSLIAFDSFSSNLVLGDTNGFEDVFVRAIYEPYSSFCAGDASPLSTPCPCANPGEMGHGCENSSTTGGGLFFATGTPSVSADTLELRAFGVPHASVAIFLQGTAQQNAGHGSVFGDGLRCLAGTQVRLGHHTASSSGSTAYGFGVVGDPHVSVRGSIRSAGGTRYYQVHYRDGAGFCSSESFNWTNAIAIAWTP